MSAESSQNRCNDWIRTTGPNRTLEQSPLCLNVKTGILGNFNVISLVGITDRGCDEITDHGSDYSLLFLLLLPSFLFSIFQTLLTSSVV